jgi:hypothetical protein
VLALALIGGCAKTYENAATDAGAPSNVIPKTDGGGSSSSSSSGSPPVDAGPTCVAKFDTDPKNCGSCGHDCEAGECKDGVCQPFILVTGEGTCDAISLSATDVFWTALGKGIDACPKSGCGEVGASFMPGIGDGVFATGNLVYGTSAGNGTASSCAVGGCNGSPKPIATGIARAGSITADTNAIYIAYGSTVGACPLTGCADLPTPLGDSMTNPTSLVVAGTYLYWSEGSSPGGIWRYPIGPAAQTAQKLIGGLPAPTQIVVDDTKIYFMQSDGGGAIGVIPLDGAANATTFASVGEFVRGIAGDANNIFVALDDSIIQIEKATATKHTVATGTFYSRGIAVDATAIYITTRQGVTKVVR